MPGSIVKNVFSKTDESPIDTSDKTWSLDNTDYKENPKEENISEADKKKQKKKLTMDTAYHFCLQKVLPMVKIEQDFVASFFKLRDSTLETFLSKMFDPLVPNLKQIISSEYKHEPYMCLLLSIQNQHFVKQYEKDSAFIYKALQACEEEISTLFDRFIASQIHNIMETKITIKRVGILDHVKKLIQFIDKMESMHAKDSDISHKAYQDIMKTIFRFINNVADLALGKKSKDQPNVGKKSRQRLSCIIRLENFHHIFSNLEIRNIVFLQAFIDEAKRHYEEAITQYLTELTQGLFGSLMTFFDGVDAIFKSMKDTEYEIRFEDQYSDRILSKTIKKFPKSTIEKGLITEYRKLHKHLSVEEGLQATVWDRLKLFMVQKYTHFEVLVAKCYPNQSLLISAQSLRECFEFAEQKYKKGGDGLLEPGHHTDSDDFTSTEFN